MRPFLHFWLISNLEAFTFVNRESALHSLYVLHEHVELVSSAILNSVCVCVPYCILYVCVCLSYCILYICVCVLANEMCLMIQKVGK